MTPDQSIEQILRREIGLDAASIGQTSILGAMKARMKKRGLSEASEYAALVASSEVELRDLIEEIIVPETWFFRDGQPFASFTRWAVGKWFPANPRTVLRVLSIPCSTGEEPYSLAMALLDAGVPVERFTVEAVDVSSRNIERATRGIYTRNSFRGEDLSFRERHFDRVPAGYRIRDEVRRLVHFRQVNLLDSAACASLGPKHVMFCRNLLIYFTPDAQKQAMTTLDRLLQPDGLLFVGHAEAYIFRTFGFVSAELESTLVFRKPGTETASSRGMVHRAPVHRTGTLASAPRPVTPTPTVPRPVVPVPAAPKVAAPVAVQSRPAVTPSLLDEAARLADEGRLDAAAERCQHYIKTQGPSSQAHYLLGLASDAAGRAEEAAQHYRKALYLEPGHHDTLVHLALLLETMGDTRGARQLQARAEKARQKGKP